MHQCVHLPAQPSVSATPAHPSMGRSCATLSAPTDTMRICMFPHHTFKKIERPRIGQLDVAGEFSRPLRKTAHMSSSGPKALLCGAGFMVFNSERWSKQKEEQQGKPSQSYREFMESPQQPREKFVRPRANHQPFCIERARKRGLTPEQAEASAPPRLSGPLVVPRPKPSPPLPFSEKFPIREVLIMNSCHLRPKFQNQSKFRPLQVRNSKMPLGTFVVACVPNCA